MDRVAPKARPRLQRAVIRFVYFGISVALRKENWAFLNYGYSPIGDASELRLQPDDEPDRYSIQLYHRVAGARDLRGKDVLEIGCGRGGGASFIARYLDPRSMTGMDISAKAVKYCRRRHRDPRLTFAQGQAEQIPVPPGSYDAVVNVESSHCYPSFERFVDEVARVLRPDGVFLIADFRPRDKVADMREGLKARFTVVEEEIITPNILRSLARDSARRLQLIQRSAPAFLHRNLTNFAGLDGSPVLDSFKSGTLQYVRFVLQKSTQTS